MLVLAATPIGNDLDKLDVLFGLGIRQCGIAYSDANALGSGCNEPVDGGLPDLTLPCLGGGPDVDLSSLRGPMVINLWQAFCEPCREEMPALEAFHQQYADQVAVVGIDFNDVNPAGALALLAA